MIADGTVLRLHEFISEEFQVRYEEQSAAIVIKITSEYEGQGISRSRDGEDDSINKVLK